MPKISFVNGSFVDHRYAFTHIEDRGYQFADGVYEVVFLMNSKFVDLAGHMKRLERSCQQLQIEMPYSAEILAAKVKQLVMMNRIKTGTIYIQITRGTAPRDFKFPKDRRANLVMTAKPCPEIPYTHFSTGVKVISVPDIRWKRRDIKSVALLPQVLAKQKAVEFGAFEAWMLDDDGFVTEGSASNAWIITKENVIVTRQADHMILSGITRSSIIHLAQKLGYQIEERPFLLSEAYEAKEAFLSSASTFVTPVVQINEHVIGNGGVGLVCSRLLEEYLHYARNATKDINWIEPELT